MKGSCVFLCFDAAVTPSRLANLEKQARSLAVHQKKLEEEVLQIESRYTNKKRKFLDDAEQFRRELKRVSYRQGSVTCYSDHCGDIDVLCEYKGTAEENLPDQAISLITTPTLTIAKTVHLYIAKSVCILAKNMPIAHSSCFAS